MMPDSHIFMNYLMRFTDTYDDMRDVAIVEALFYLDVRTWSIDDCDNEICDLIDDYDELVI